MSWSLIFHKTFCCCFSTFHFEPRYQRVKMWCLLSVVTLSGWPLHAVHGSAAKQKCSCVLETLDMSHFLSMWPIFLFSRLMSMSLDALGLKYIVILLGKYIGICLVSKTYVLHFYFEIYCKQLSLQWEYSMVKTDRDESTCDRSILSW